MAFTVQARIIHNISIITDNIIKKTIKGKVKGVKGKLRAERAKQDFNLQTGKTHKILGKMN